MVLLWFSERLADFIVWLVAQGILGGIAGLLDLAGAGGGMHGFAVWVDDILRTPSVFSAFTWLIASVIILVFALLNTIMVIWLERKMLGRFMDRRGAMHVGYAGLLQNIADGLKLFVKEDILPAKADRFGYVFGVTVYIASSVAVLAFIPFATGFSLPLPTEGLLFALAAFALAPFAIFVAGWSSNNKYTLIGGMRSAAQIISYEVPLILSVAAMVILTGSLSLAGIGEAQAGGHWFVIPQILGFLIFFVTMIAEVERIPFDLPEAEAELVEGWTTEYGSMRFGLIMFTDYLRAFVACALATVLFLGGSAPVEMFGFSLGIPAGAFPGAATVSGLVWFLLKTYLLFAVMIWVRASYPRVRVDQLLRLSWSFLVPLAFVNLIIAFATVIVLVTFGWLAGALFGLGASLLVLVACLATINEPAIAETEAEGS
jgi:NADH-quinone oxidoreductase subunit H